MNDVIENCQVTFEEDGINQQTLNDLRTVGLSFLFCFSSFAVSWGDQFSYIPLSST